MMSMQLFVIILQIFYPQALVIATSALTAYKNLGLPEGKIPLYNAIIYVCEAPKSNRSTFAAFMTFARTRFLSKPFCNGT